MTVSSTVYDLLSAPEVIRSGPEETRKFMIEQLHELIDILYFYEMTAADIRSEVEKNISKHKDTNGKH